MISRRKLIRLLPSHNNVYLARWGYCDDQKLARAFGRAWRRIPYGDRRQILAHWRTPHFFAVQWPQERKAPHRDSPPEEFISGVVIEALPGWSLRRRGELGGTGAEGFQVRFWAPAVDVMPEDILEILVMHELGHVYCESKGREEGYHCSNTTDSERELNELFDREMMDHWEIDEDKLDAFLETWAAPEDPDEDVSR